MLPRFRSFNVGILLSSARCGGKLHSISKPQCRQLCGFSSSVHHPPHPLGGCSVFFPRRMREKILREVEKDIDASAEGRVGGRSFFSSGERGREFLLAEGGERKGSLFCVGAWQRRVRRAFDARR